MVNLYDKIEGAKNFTLYELIKSKTADKFNIDNIPKDDYIFDNLKYLAVNCLQKIRDEFGAILINSGYRCEVLNNKVGGSINSNHLRGFAADIVPIDKSVKLIDIVNFIFYNIIYHELILEYFDGDRPWIHLSYRKPIKILKLKDRNHHYTRVSIDYINNIYR